MAKTLKLVLLRHGESTWNKENRFTGWTDVDLSKKGVKEAKESGRILKKKGFVFDIAFTSVLKRATRTLSIVLNEINQKSLPVEKSWRLNERHYGDLQGLNKSEMAKKFGEKQVHKWRRSYSTRPPALTKKDKRWPGNQKKYESVPKKFLPLTESLKDTVARVLPYWKKSIVPELKKGKTILVSAHGNSLRALVKHLDKISEKEVMNLNIPTGIPLVYEFDKNLKVKKHYYLADKSTLKKEVERIKRQGRKS